MPPEVAARYEPPHWHGWVMDDDGNIVPEKAGRKWSALCYESRRDNNGSDEQKQGKGR